LYFLPLPHQHGSLRPIAVAGRRIVAEDGTEEGHGSDGMGSNSG
jgi:hypothetical protein